MPDFHDPFVQFIVDAIIAIIVGAAAVLMSVWIYRKQKNRKEISYTLVFTAPVVSVRPSVADRVKIYLDGNEITEAQLVVLAIKNTGNVAVKREDYDEPITIDFSPHKILSADVLKTKPQSLFKSGDEKTFITSNNSSMTLAKQLLNPNEEIRLVSLLDGLEAEPHVRARIVDGGVVQDNLVKCINTRIMIAVLIIPALVSFPMIAYAQQASREFNLVLPIYLFAIIGFVAAAAFTVFALSHIIVYRKSMKEAPGESD